jgi:hypothetical protein
MSYFDLIAEIIMVISLSVISVFIFADVSFELGLKIVVISSSITICVIIIREISDFISKKIERNEGNEEDER